MLKYLYDNQSDIPEAYRSLYQQDASGKWVLQCEGIAPKAALDEFRNNNIAIARERDALQTKFANVDPEEYKKLKNNSRLLDEKELVHKSGVEELVNQRTITMKTEFEGKVTGLSTDLEKTRSELGKLKIDGTAVTHGAKYGLRPEAHTDFINRANSIFKMDPKTGDVAAYEPDGTIKYGADGKPLQLGDWVKQVATDKGFQHLFTPSQGGGAAGGGRGASGGNPFKSGNVTDQARLYKENPQEYTRLKSEHEAASAAAG